MDFLDTFQGIFKNISSFDTFSQLAARKSMLKMKKKNTLNAL